MQRRPTTPTPASRSSDSTWYTQGVFLPLSIMILFVHVYNSFPRLFTSVFVVSDAYCDYGCAGWNIDGCLALCRVARTRLRVGDLRYRPAPPLLLVIVISLSCYFLISLCAFNSIVSPASPQTHKQELRYKRLSWTLTRWRRAAVRCSHSAPACLLSGPSPRAPTPVRSAVPACCLFLLLCVSLCRGERFRLSGVRMVVRSCVIFLSTLELLSLTHLLTFSPAGRPCVLPQERSSQSHRRQRRAGPSAAGLLPEDIWAERAGAAGCGGGAPCDGRHHARDQRILCSVRYRLCFPVLPPSVVFFEVARFLCSAVSSPIDVVAGTPALSVDEVAYGFVRVANEAMCRPIRSLTEAKGHDTVRSLSLCISLYISTLWAMKTCCMNVALTCFTTCLLSLLHTLYASDLCPSIGSLPHSRSGTTCWRALAEPAASMHVPLPAASAWRPWSYRASRACCLRTAWPSPMSLRTCRCGAACALSGPSAFSVCFVPTSCLISRVMSIVSLSVSTVSAAVTHDLTYVFMCLCRSRVQPYCGRRSCPPFTPSWTPSLVRASSYYCLPA